MLLDAYAVIGYLQDDPHVGSAVKAIISPRSRRRRAPLAITAVNAAEVVDHLIRIRHAPADEAVLDLAQLGLNTIAVDLDVAIHAGLLRARYYNARTCQVSLADCVAAAALLLDDDLDRLATADPDLLDIVHAEGGATRPLPGTDGTIWTPSPR